MKYTGTLMKELTQKGTPSEREVLVLKTNIVTLILRRFGSNPLEMDEELLEHLEETITVEGNQNGSFLFFKELDFE